MAKRKLGCESALSSEVFIPPAKGVAPVFKDRSRPRQHGDISLGTLHGPVAQLVRAHA
jgi:hypothetical protein